MKKFMELEIPLIINNKIKNSKKTIKHFGIGVAGLTFVIGLGFITVIAIRANDDQNMKNYVYNLMATDMTSFVNPNKSELKELKEEELITKLTDNSKMDIENYESILTKFLIETNDITLETSEKIFKIYKLKLLEHASEKIKEFNLWEKENCLGIVGCNLDARYDARNILEDGLKDKLKDKEEIFLSTIIKILNKDTPENEETPSNTGIKDNKTENLRKVEV